MADPRPRLLCCFARLLDDPVTASCGFRCERRGGEMRGQHLCDLPVADWSLETFDGLAVFEEDEGRHMP